MNTAQTDIFEVLNETKSDPAMMLDRIVDHLRSSRQPMELFEALKMRTRHRLGIDLLPSADEPARPEDVERQAIRIRSVGCVSRNGFDVDRR